MKKLISLAVIVSLSFSARAAEILEMQTVRVHGIEIKLPKTLFENQVCVTFVKSSSQKKELTVITTDKICGEKFEVADGLGTSNIYPENLKSMRFDHENQNHIINE
jgi:hypothetical protein